MTESAQEYVTTVSTPFTVVAESFLAARVSVRRAGGPTVVESPNGRGCAAVVKGRRRSKKIQRMATSETDLQYETRGTNYSRIISKGGFKDAHGAPMGSQYARPDCRFNSFEDKARGIGDSPADDDDIQIEDVER